jgi:hypothetical protein
MLTCPDTPELGLPSTHSGAMGFSPARRSAASVLRHQAGYWCNMQASRRIKSLPEPARFGSTAAKGAPNGGKPPFGTSMWRLERGVHAALHFCGSTAETGSKSSEK